MQSIALPFTASDDDAAAIHARRLAFGRVTRAGYRDAAWWDVPTEDAAPAPRATRQSKRRRDRSLGLAYREPSAHRRETRPGNWVFRDERELVDRMKARFAGDKLVDAWLVLCACKEAMALRRRTPDGDAVFGGKAAFERRRKHLISNKEWKTARLRPVVSYGDKGFHGNRHFRLSADARTCTFSVRGEPVTLHLPQMHGTWGELLPMLAKLAAAKEINLTFRLGSDRHGKGRLVVTFDPKDLRPLPAGVTLQAQKDADLAAAGRKARGRKRGPDYVPPPNPWSEENPRPVHPRWEGAFCAKPNRAAGLDSNPGGFGLTITENDGDVRSLRDTRVLAYRYVSLDLPPDASDDLVREVLAKVAGVVVALCRDWACDLIAIEEGLGKLRSRTDNKRLNRSINGWARRVLQLILERRAAMSGIRVLPVWGGYSTTIGNIGFSLPDACAAAAEIARRGLAAVARVKESLPTYDAAVVSDLWKDRGLPTPETVTTARSWVAVHRELKTAKLGVRRPHPGTEHGPPGHDGRGPVAHGHAVARLGHRGRPGTVYRPLRSAKGDTPSSG